MVIYNYNILKNMVKIHMYKKEIKKICTHQHLVIEDIVKRLREKFPKAGLSTVYRNLDEMVSTGELKKLKVLWSKGVYETNIGNHAHLIDNKTGRITDVEISQLDTSFIPTNFSTKNIELNIYGEFEK